MKQDELKKEPTAEDAKEENLKEILEDLSVNREVKSELINKSAEAERELRDKIEKMHLPYDLKQQSKKDSRTLSALEEKGKMDELLKIAKEKGVIYAVNVAKNIGDPYILDRFHDILAKAGHYKDFTQ